MAYNDFRGGIRVA